MRAADSHRPSRLVGSDRAGSVLGVAPDPPLVERHGESRLPSKLSSVSLTMTPTRSQQASRVHRGGRASKQQNADSLAGFKSPQGILSFFYVAIKLLNSTYHNLT